LKTFFKAIERGFTLIEVLVVVFIIGILLTVAVGSFNPRTTTDMQEKAGKIRNLIVQLRNNSILDNKVYRLILFKEYLDVLMYEKATATAPDDAAKLAEETDEQETDDSQTPQLPLNWVSITEKDTQISWDKALMSVEVKHGGDSFLDEYQFKLENSFDTSFEDIVIFWPSGLLSGEGKLMLESEDNPDANMDVRWDIHGKVTLQLTQY
jgi:prepilin-type N-terminal cleavage/methylation domain-containing protein